MTSIIQEEIQPLFETNKSLWNRRTGAHFTSEFYDVEGFRKGENKLTCIERNELTEVEGKSLLHLQCHFGLDTLSWARLGAKVTGLDFSEDAIVKAKALAAEFQPDAKFICANIYDAEQHIHEKFDIVFTSFGCICWLPDLDAWAGNISRMLKPGGIFYIADFHPTYMMFDFNTLKPAYSYFNDGVIEEEVKGSYAVPERETETPQKEYSWNHGFAESIGALQKAGLQMEFLHEFPFSPYNVFPNMIPDGKGNYQIQGYEGILPLTYSMKWTKKS